MSKGTRGSQGADDVRLLALIERDDLPEDAFESLRELGELPEPAWTRLVQESAALRSAATVERLIHHAHRLLGRHPCKSVVLSGLATRVAASLVSPETKPDLAIR